jgi:hypothetical protein
VKVRELWIGVVLAAALVVGFLWTRGGTDASTPVDLDVTRADGELVSGDVEVSVRAEPRPLRVFERLRFAFRFERGGEPLEVSEPFVDFDMTMDMGAHGYALVRDEAGAWVAEDVVLPQCASGSRLWFGELTFTADGEPHLARLRMELEPPHGD